jgi:hypothetical protein
MTQEGETPETVYLVRSVPSGRVTLPQRNRAGQSSPHTTPPQARHSRKVRGRHPVQAARHSAIRAACRAESSQDPRLRLLSDSGFMYVCSSTFQVVFLRQTRHSRTRHYGPELQAAQHLLYIKNMVPCLFKCTRRHWLPPVYHSPRVGNAARATHIQTDTGMRACDVRLAACYTAPACVFTQSAGLRNSQGAATHDR